jgi:hypothetical protein
MIVNSNVQVKPKLVEIFWKRDFLRKIKKSEKNA